MIQLFELRLASTHHIKTALWRHVVCMHILVAIETRNTLNHTDSCACVCVCERKRMCAYECVYACVRETPLHRNHAERPQSLQWPSSSWDPL